MIVVEPVSVAPGAADPRFTDGASTLTPMAVRCVVDDNVVQLVGAPYAPEVVLYERMRNVYVRSVSNEPCACGEVAGSITTSAPAAHVAFGEIVSSYLVAPVAAVHVKFADVVVIEFEFGALGAAGGVVALAVDEHVDSCTPSAFTAHTLYVYAVFAASPVTSLVGTADVATTVAYASALDRML